MFQDIAPYKFYNEFHPQPPVDDSYICVCSENSILAVLEDRMLALPTFKELRHSYDVSEDQLIFLFTIDDNHYYLLKQKLPEDGFYHYIDTDSLRTLEQNFTLFAASLGVQLNRWYQTNKYCGQCGAATVPHLKERALVCGGCGRITYPTLAPSVIVGLIDGDRILLTKYAGRAYTRYALVAGYVEFGETLEETVKREVMEEVGLKVKNIRYYKSQPWPFSDSLLAGFFAELDGDDKVTLEEEELAEATWFHRDEMPDTSGTFSLTNDMIELFRNKDNSYL